MTIIEKAEYFAKGAHRESNHRRKYTNEPYEAHLEEVAALTKQYGGTDEMIAAAWLHDVLEDTNTKSFDIAAVFGIKILDLVYGLTKFSKPEDGNRAKRAELDRAFLAMQDAEVQTIKVADLISNTSTIVEYDPKFAVVYLEEKRLLLEVLTKADPYILEFAWAVLVYQSEKLKAKND